MSFRIRGLSPEPFSHLFGLADAELATHGALRVVADKPVGYPDRVSLADAAPGDRLILVNYEHQDAPTPYRASHAIFVREDEAAEPFDAVDRVPAMFRLRPISLRAFDSAGMMVGADLAEGDGLEDAIERLLANPAAAYLHAHLARPGCFAARIDRA